MEKWIELELSSVEYDYSQHLDKYRFDLAANVIYEFIWDKYCDWYIEMVKIFLYEENIPTSRKESIATNLVSNLQRALVTLHPIMPFITEELWTILEKERGSQQKFSEIIVKPPSKPKKISLEVANIKMLMAFISEVRKLRTSLRAKPNQKINIYIDDNEKLKYLGELDNIKTIKKLVNVLKDISKELV